MYGTDKTEENRKVMNIDSNRFQANSVNEVNKQKKGFWAFKKFDNWLVGFVVSLIPLALPLIRVAKLNASMLEYIIKVLSGAELLYVGISLTVTSLNDFSEGRRGEFDFALHIILLIVGSAIYGMLVEPQGTSADSGCDWIASVVNLVFMFVTIVICTIHYIFEYKKESRGMYQ